MDSDDIARMRCAQPVDSRNAGSTRKAAALVAACDIVDPKAIAVGTKPGLIVLGEGLEQANAWESETWYQRPNLCAAYCAHDQWRPRRTGARLPPAPAWMLSPACTPAPLLNCCLRIRCGNEAEQFSICASPIRYPVEAAVGTTSNWTLA